MKKKERLAEFDNHIDTLNVVFGAALGGYIGIVIATKNLPERQMWTLVLILFIISQILTSPREIAKCLNNDVYYGFRFPWNLSFVVFQVLVVQLLAFQIPVSGETFSIIFRGWVFLIALGLLDIYVRRWLKNRRREK